MDKLRKAFRLSPDMLADLKTITEQQYCNETKALAYALQQAAKQTRPDTPTKRA